MSSSGPPVGKREHGENLAKYTAPVLFSMKEWESGAGQWQVAQRGSSSPRPSGGSQVQSIPPHESQADPRQVEDHGR